MKNEPYHMEKLNTFTIKIYIDEDPQNPREWDNLGELIKFRGTSYTFWDKSQDYEIFLQDMGEMGYPDDEYVLNEDGEDTENPSLEGLIRMAKRKSENIWIPVDIYDYNYGARMSESTDSEPDGAIIADFQTIRKEYNCQTITPEIEEKVRARLKGETGSMNNYLSGECYGYVIEDASGESLDSCWGFLGDYKYCLEEAKSVVKAYDYQLKSERR